MIDLCTLGTGGTMPLPDRALASLYVRVGGRAVLLRARERDDEALGAQAEPLLVGAEGRVVPAS